jgi:hypothetical protein
MLNIAPPELSPHEWEVVRTTLAALADCGCATPPQPGSLRDRFGRIIDALAGREHRVMTLDPTDQAVHDFLCESGRIGGIAEDHVATLGTHGFSRPQIEALALIGA